MAKKKTQIKVSADKPSKKLDIPQNLIDCYSSISKELESKEFTFKNSMEYKTNNSYGSETYNSESQSVVLEVKSDNIVVRQYELLDKGESRKLRAIYVQKPQQRTFKLL